MKVWNVNTGECVATLEGHSRDVTSVSFSPDGKLIASGSWDGKINIWGVVDEYATTIDHVTIPFVVPKLKF